MHTTFSSNGKLYTAANDAEARSMGPGIGHKKTGQGESYASKFGGYLSGITDYMFNNAYNAADQRITEDELAQTAEVNRAQAGALNRGALASSRRRPGGTTFRRKGSATTANQLVSGLGVANVQALANQRRALARKNAGQIGAIGTGNMISIGSGGMGGGPTMS